MTIVSLAQAKDYFRADSSLGGVDDATIAAVLASTDSLVFEYCGRVIQLATTGSARLYTPSSADQQALSIHDCTSISAITEWGSTLDPTLYQTEPINSLTSSGTYSPITTVRIYGRPWTYWQGLAKISVTATWGWASIPDAVTEAALIIAKDIYQQRNVSSGVAGFGDFGPVRVRVNPIAMNLLVPYRRAEAYGVA